MGATAATGLNNDLRIIGSAMRAGIPAVATGDKQFALRAAQNNLQVFFRSFDPTLGPINRIQDLGLAQRRFDQAVRSGQLSPAQRALIDIQ